MLRNNYFLNLFPQIFTSALTRIWQQQKLEFACYLCAIRPVTYIPRYTIKDYNRWDGDWELIDGLPYAMSPSPVRIHQRLAAILITQISLALGKTACKECETVFELDWIIDDLTVLRPDVAVICQKKGDFITSPPALIVEIISASTALKDRQIKFEIYQEQGVQYYIIADPGLKTFQIFQLSDGKYREQNALKKFSMHGKCIVELNMQAALNALE